MNDVTRDLLVIGSILGIISVITAFAYLHELAFQGLGAL